jgi:hypothetical protein
LTKKWPGTNTVPKINLSGFFAANVVPETTTKINTITKTKHLNFFNIIFHPHFLAIS